MNNTARAVAGVPPREGWAPLSVELHVTDLAASLAFWCDILGFGIAFERAEERFVYLEHADGPQIMLCQRHGRFETALMSHPFGRGVLIQAYIAHLEPVLRALEARDWPICLGPREIWRQTGDRRSGQVEVFVQDPDGYLVMVAQDVGS